MPEISETRATGPLLRAGAMEPASDAATKARKHTTSEYASTLLRAIGGHWVEGEFTDWSLNFVMLHHIAKACDEPALCKRITARALGYAYNFSHQAGLQKTMHWQGSPFNNNITHYHRSHVAVPSKKVDEALTRSVNNGEIEVPGPKHSWHAMAVSSPRATRAIGRQLVGENRILGSVSTEKASLPDLRGKNRNASILVTGNGIHDENFHTAVERSGYAASPSSAIESIVALTPEKDLLNYCFEDHAARSFVAEHTAGPSSRNIDLTADHAAPSWRGLVDSPQFKYLESKTGSTALAPVFKGIGDPMLASLRGLMRIEQQLDGWATSAGRKLLLSYIGGRIAQHLSRAAQHLTKHSEHDDMSMQYINDMRLVHEEVTSLLSIVQPYRPADLDLQMPAASAANGGIEPVYTMRNTGLNVFNALLNTSEEMNARAGHTQGSMPRVVTQSNVYYEIVFGLESSAGYLKLPRFDGDIASNIEALEAALPKDEKVDLFVGQFHDNLSLGVDIYKPQPLQSQVRAMLDSGLAAGRFTVAVDNTIGRLDAPELKALVDDLANDIEAGRVNLVVFRSSLKFDLAGMDNVSSALIASYNNGDSHWNRFDASMYSPSAMQGPDFQVTCHLQKHSQNALNDYRSAIAAQHRSMLDMLPADMTSNPPGAAAVQIVPSDDPHAVFLHMRPSPELLAVGGDARRIAQIMSEVAMSQGMYFTVRPSLGHAHSTMAPVDARAERITLGLESKEKMKMLSKVMAAVNDVGMEAIRRKNRSETDDLFSTMQPALHAFNARRDAHQASSAFTRRT